jgi:hypothetical protein
MDPKVQSRVVGDPDRLRQVPTYPPGPFPSPPAHPPFCFTPSLCLPLTYSNSACAAVSLIISRHFCPSKLSANLADPFQPTVKLSRKTSFLFLFADRSFCQILLNLLSNAIKFTPVGQVQEPPLLQTSIEQCNVHLYGVANLNFFSLLFGRVSQSSPFGSPKVLIHAVLCARGAQVYVVADVVETGATDVTFQFKVSRSSEASVLDSVSSSPRSRQASYRFLGIGFAL